MPVIAAIKRSLILSWIKRN